MPTPDTAPSRFALPQVPHTTVRRYWIRSLPLCRSILRRGYTQHGQLFGRRIYVSYLVQGTISAWHPEGIGNNKTAFMERELYGGLTFRASFVVDEAGTESSVTGLVLPAGFELPEGFLGYGIPLEKLQIHFDKVQ